MGNKASNIGENRTIEIGVQNYSYSNNRLISSKYTLWNFLPKNLFKQFRRLANFYFLCMSIITTTIDSPVSPWASVTPLIIVVSVSAVKQAYEDWLRHQADNRTNSIGVMVFHQGVLQLAASQDVRVGDLIKVENENDIPCDLIILTTSRPDSKCYAMTSNLDGETNLKRFECPVHNLLNQNNIGEVTGKIKCEKPTSDLYYFKGELEVNIENGHSTRNTNPELICSGGNPRALHRTSLSANNLLLKGSRLKNTEFVIGCAIYTGHDTKLALNSCRTRNKAARSERFINFYLIFFLCLLVLEVLISVIMDFYEVNYGEYRPYLGPWSGFTVKNVVNELFSYVVLYYYIIPISLYVTVELQRFLGTLYLKWDINLCYNGQNSSAKTSDINEDLGQVEYIFTDKTGTLTENEMTLRHVSANGISYTEHNGEVFEGYKTNENSHLNEWPVHLETLFLGMVLCHTVQCTDNLGKTRTNYESQTTTYEASSPDEKALIEACSRCGVLYLGEEAGIISINFRGKLKKFKKVKTAEFTSERKRMSVLVVQEDGKGLLVCKGAECAVFPLISHGKLEKEQRNAKKFAMKGLRTLIFAYKELDEAELNFTLSMPDFPENNLLLLGVSAVEDRLQPHVGKTLSFLEEAGIKIWILTGDRVETAMNVSLACGHTRVDMLQLTFVEFFDATACLEHLKMLKSQIQHSRVTYSLIIDGRSLKVAVDNPECNCILRDIMPLAHSVVCCRLAPKQKAQIVHLAKEFFNRPLTLAIGDGANDVAMIQEAHVGIGLLGKEGRQAVNNADFVLPAFFTLQRILFVHGHWYYLRLAVLVQYFFYKNIVFITPQVFFAIHNGVSPQPLFSSVFLLLYNTAFTSLPILLYSLLEQDYPAEKLLMEPLLYRLYRQNALLSWPEFFKWIFYGVWHSVVVYFIPWGIIMENPIILLGGQPMDMTGFGTTVIHCSIIVVNLKLLLFSHFWTSYFLLSFGLSIVGFIVFTIIYSMIDMLDPLYSVYMKLMQSPQFWLLTFLVTSLSLIPDFMFHVVSKRLSGNQKNIPKTFRTYTGEETELL